MRRERTLLVGAVALVALMIGGVALAQDGGPGGQSEPAEALGTRASGALSTAFTYQGRLTQNGEPIDGTCDFRFILYDAADGNPVGAAQEKLDQPVTDGYFTVEDLDFGSDAFAGDRRWLGVEVDCAGDGTYTDLGKEELTAAPYALYASSTAALQGYPISAAAPDSGEVLSWDGSHWSPASPSAGGNGSGDITAVRAGDGLGGGGESGSVTLYVLTSTIQSRVGGTCDPGSSIRLVNQDGTVACETDDDTTYSAGTGLALDGTEFAAQGSPYANALVVAKSGGDYSSVQAAVDSVDEASSSNPYLIWVAPGVYNESVTMKPHVHVQGAGQDATVISSTATSGDWPPTTGTLVLTDHVSLRDLSVSNLGTGTRNVALIGTEGTSETVVTDVTVRAQGEGNINYAVFLTGSGTEVTLQRITGLAENGSSNYGLFSRSGADAALELGSYTAVGGSSAQGLYSRDAGTTLEAHGVTALGRDASSSVGLYIIQGAGAVLHGGSFIGRGGTDAKGIYNYIGGATLEAEGITAVGEDGTSINYGLHTALGVAATLRDGSYRGRGGNHAAGIYSTGSGATLQADSVNAAAESGTDTNYGLRNASDATATLHGGGFLADGGTVASGIYNEGSSTTLNTVDVEAVGDNGSTVNYGLYNEATATLRSTYATARGNAFAYGIYNYGNHATLEADYVTASAENSSSSNEAQGLHNEYYATATLHGGSFVGDGGSSARGIVNSGSSATLIAGDFSSRAENASTNNYGLENYQGTATLRRGSCVGRGGVAYGIYTRWSGASLTGQHLTSVGENGGTNYGIRIDGGTATLHQSVLDGVDNSAVRSSGTITVANSRLIGGATSGTITCVAVSRGGNWSQNSCP